MLTHYEVDGEQHLLGLSGTIYSLPEGKTEDDLSEEEKCKYVIDS
jgi:hypothetical protein